LRRIKSLVGLGVTSSALSNIDLNFLMSYSFRLRRRTLSNSPLFWNKSAIALRALQDSRLTSGDEFPLKDTSVDKKVLRSFNRSIDFPSLSIITLKANDIFAFEILALLFAFEYWSNALITFPSEQC